MNFALLADILKSIAPYSYGLGIAKSGGWHIC
jgi:hypothetical protein